MSAPPSLQHPQSLDDLLLFRLSHLVAVAGAPVIQLCEGRYGITRREWRLIVGLQQHGPMLSSELATQVHLDRGRTSKAITELVHKGLVVRTPRPHDRRQVQLSLTDAAQAIYAQLFPAIVALNQHLLIALSPDQVQALDSTLTALHHQASARAVHADAPKANRRSGKRAGVSAGSPRVAG